jgi:hypothetical protein
LTGGVVTALILALLPVIPAPAHAQVGPETTPGTAGPAAAPRVIIAFLPHATDVEDIGGVDGISPGVISAGIGVVPSSQTYLDISQGNRVCENFYDGDLLPLIVERGRVVPRFWRRLVQRAEGAPADVVPGLLASTLEGAGTPVVAERGIGAAAGVAVNEQGRVGLVPQRRCRSRGCGPGLSVIGTNSSELPRMVNALRGEDLLIAIAAAPPPDHHLLAAGIAGAGFDGTLTSDSTRTRGVVLSTDVAPTVLERLGVEVPDEMNGTAVRTEDEPDAAEVADLQQRLSERPDRDLVLLLPLATWIALTALAALLFREPGARAALPVLALSCAWAPLMLLVGAALEPGELAEAMIVGSGAPALALATSRRVPGFAGLAVACGVTVGAHAVDVIAGSPLTALSVLGPNPASGVRFFGIGNELEAALTTLTLIGVGAWLASRPAISGRAAAGWFLAVAALTAAAFAPGRFGADVGAAIVLAAGGGAAAAVALDLGRVRTAAVIAGLPILGLLALVLVDLALGGAHLTRSVLGAGDSGDLAQVLERRLTLTARSFTDPVYPELLVLAIVLVAAGTVWRHRIAAWFDDRWPARCGYIGALVGIAVGTLANDSGAILLVIGAILLAVFAGYFWAVRGPAPVRLAAGPPRAGER